jgi:molybdenum cofactor cytidylyltransferase
MKNLIPITAIVLAAGASTRMGDFKPLLPLDDGTPMLEAVLTKVVSFPFLEVIAVVGHKEQEIREAIQIQDPRFTWVSNPNYKEGLSSSIKLAIHQHDKQAQGIMVFLGDQPLLKESTIDTILLNVINMLTDQSKWIIQPAFDGKPGHPVFISATMVPYLHNISGDQGAKPIFHRADKHIIIPIDDQGVILDIDTKQDYLAVINDLKWP